MLTNLSDHLFLLTLHPLPFHIPITVLHGTASAMPGNLYVVTTTLVLVSRIIVWLTIPTGLAFLSISIPSGICVRIFVVQRDRLCLFLRPAFFRIQPAVYCIVFHFEFLRDLRSCLSLRCQFQCYLFLRLSGRKRITHLRPRRGGYWIPVLQVLPASDRIHGP